ncbi:cupin domain-containing protein [Candidatus Parcubacteria bacterium]|nr:MAG: cupin domain-containing protein [Candidatus Parcubacteria bacterium]
MIPIISAHSAKGAFFKVLATTEKSQVAVMTLEPGEDSGEGDIHTGDQVIYILEGEARVVVKDEEGIARKGDVTVIPAQSPHRIYNNVGATLFFLSFYSSPEY